MRLAKGADGLGGSDRPMAHCHADLASPCHATVFKVDLWASDSRLGWLIGIRMLKAHLHAVLKAGFAKTKRRSSDRGSLEISNKIY